MKKQETVAVIGDKDGSSAKLKEEKLKTQDTKIDAGTSIGNEGSPTLEISEETAKKEETIDDSSNSTLTVPDATVPDAKDSEEIIEAEIFTSLIRSDLIPLFGILTQNENAWL